MAESAEYDPTQNRFLISNGNNMLARASDGTLSFFGNGSTSHGLEVLGDHVFGLSSGNVLKAFDLVTEEEVMSLTINGALFLNGLTTDGANTLYATDFSADKIYKIDVTDINNPTFEIIVDDTSKTPNGIIYDGDQNRLVFVTWGSNADIRQVDLSDNTMSIITTTNLGSIDGIDDDNNNNYYISSWAPSQITKYDSNFENPEIISVPGINQPADIGYAKAIDTLAIPQGNSVDYIGFEVMTPSRELGSSDFGLTVYPNPVSNNSWIQFELEQTATIDLSLYDMQGRKVKNLLGGTQSFGQHKVLLNGIALEKGIYACVLNIKTSANQNRVSTVEIIVE